MNSQSNRASPSQSKQLPSQKSETKITHKPQNQLPISVNNAASAPTKENVTFDEEFHDNTKPTRFGDWQINCRTIDF